MPNTREKLVELLKQSPFEGKVLDEWWLEDKIARIADHLITNGVTVPDKNVGKWIPVTERLPEESGEYLAYCGEYDGICVLYYEVLKTKGKWRTKWKDDVTHWMPLPEAPKGD